ncbi:MAG: hypothetical protein KKA61_01455, partial [Nanoarchaeota archaeon]|nr:hypothetical protein [Nanoarchaeota archaeon]
MQIKPIMVFLITLALLTQPVSAGFLDDIINIITGRVTKEVEEITAEPEPELVPEEPVEKVPEGSEASGGGGGVPVIPAEEEELVEEEPEPCTPIPITMLCPGCDEEDIQKCLCPMKTDEKGCSFWDCDACETTPGEECIDNFDCPSGMKCENSVCVDVGCIEEGQRTPTVATSPEGFEMLEHMATECCGGLREIIQPDEFDENCNLKPLKVGVIGGRTVCSNCGNGICESWETKCNCPEDCIPRVPPVPPVECKEGKVKNYVCEDGTEVPECECSSNMWVCKISPENACPELPTPKVCAASIKVTFDKSIYYVGDYATVIIDIFDSQGNHLPNYLFYGQMYDDRWHTPDLMKTNEKGYFRATNRVEDNVAVDIGKIKLKVYTKEIGDCGEIQDIIEIKLKRKEPEPCGIGKCVPELECEDKVRMCGGPCVPCPEEEEEEKIFYPCRGCELEDKCYPFGYRKAGKYCSDNNQFVTQLGADASCDNNFECKTNLCIDGECISSSLWRRILAWIKRLIGKPEPPKPEPKPEVDCSELLIEKDIGDYKYKESAYGNVKETQAPLISDEGEQIGTIKCCAAQYLDQNEIRGMALVCPYENRKYVENLIKIGLNQAPGARFILEDYKGEKVYIDKWISMVWTHENYAVATGRDHRQEGSI